MSNTAEINELIASARTDPKASEELFLRIYGDLRRIARGQLRNRPATISATEVVHEAYLKLGDLDSLNVKDRGHLFAVAAKAMRQLLVDRYRRRAAQKRGGNEVAITLNDERQLGESQNEPDLLVLDEALEELAELSGRMARVVELKFFGGLTQDEIAEVEGVSKRTIGSDWRKAKAWLSYRLKD